MIRALTSQPFFVLLMGIGTFAMLGPAILAASLGDDLAVRSFAQTMLLFVFLTVLIGLATREYRPGSVVRSQLLALLAAFTLLPLMFAVPFYAALPRVGFLNAWFEMISSFTTTGATIFDSPSQLSAPLHFWRAIVGWLGGVLIWVTAVAIFAPLSIGGFEVRAGGNLNQSSWFTQIARIRDPSERLARYALRLVPIYVALTLTLWLSLAVVGEDPFVALCHAMSILSTSGISPVGGMSNAQAGFPGEVLIALFLIFALSRLTFSRGLLGEDRGRLLYDPEIKMALYLMVIVTGFLFVRHWFALDLTAGLFGISELASSIWGSVFTTLSFLTTTGYESKYWVQSVQWAGLQSPGLILVGLSLVGGGIATSAGGVKLLRVYALYKHGLREVEKLIHPHSVGGAGQEARHIRKQGATIAWVFFMLFALSVAAIMVLISLTGVAFETSMVLTVSALSTNGPLAQMAAETPISYSGIPDMAKLILSAAMVLGRLETLAIIALLNPELWRR